MRKDGSRQRLFSNSFFYNPKSWPYPTRRCIIVAAKISKDLTFNFVSFFARYELVCEEV